MDDTPSDKKSKQFWKQSNWEKIFHSQRIICYWHNKTGKTYQKQEKETLQKFWSKRSIWKLMNGQSAKKWFSRFKIKLLQRVNFVWHIRLKVIMRVSEEIHKLLRNITRLRRKPLKRWEKPVNQNYEKQFKWISWLDISQFLSVK